MSAVDAIRWVAERFDTRDVAVACSMANGVLPHIVSAQLPGVDVLFLDTGYHFAETRWTRDDVARRLDVRVVDLQPEHSVAEQDAEYGPRLYERNPSLCCALRKVAPLNRALAGYRLWLTGVRREESPTRANAPLISFDDAHGLIKVNPLAAWTLDDLTGYAARHDVPVNPLVAEGYLSIGCAPCTLPVAAGADPRSGRWAGRTKTECGIHQ
nr:phosphoadenylyl-sulfate reductase [Spelaeicoccus albus]